jgi:hypothetical protein
MTDIIIDSSKQTLHVAVKATSWQTLKFEIKVYDSDGDTILEEIEGTTKGCSNWMQPLKLKPSESDGKFISGLFHFLLPGSSDFDYHASFNLIEDNTFLQPEIKLAGLSLNDEVVRAGNFHISSVG